MKRLQQMPVYSSVPQMATSVCPPNIFAPRVELPPCLVLASVRTGNNLRYRCETRSYPIDPDAHPACFCRHMQPSVLRSRDTILPLWKRKLLVGTQCPLVMHYDPVMWNNMLSVTVNTSCCVFNCPVPTSQPCLFYWEKSYNLTLHPLQLYSFSRT